MIIISDDSRSVTIRGVDNERDHVVYVADDNAAMSYLLTMAESITQSTQQKIECFIIFRCATSLWLLQTLGVPQAVYATVDLLATTREDLIAKNLLVRLPQQHHHVTLDRTPIRYNSDTTIHVVLAGWSAMTEALALNIAHIAHYTNYCRDVRRRTRITILDDNVYTCRKALTQRYEHLFNHSYYRTIDLTCDCPQAMLYKPMYGNRKDFVDIEWEFINGDIHNSAAREKLALWCSSLQQQVTIAIAYPDEERNITTALSLPEVVYATATPILCHTESILMSGSPALPHLTSLYYLNDDLCSIDILRTIKRLAQRINYVYHYCFEHSDGHRPNVPLTIDDSVAQALWHNIGSLPKQYSNIFNAMTLGTKMHSLGHSEEQWDDFFALSTEEIALLSEVEHNRWCVEELLLGYRPVNDIEQQAIDDDPMLKSTFRDRKIHYDLRSFDDLREDCTKRNVQLYDLALTQAIPLIVRECISE